MTMTTRQEVRSTDDQRYDPSTLEEFIGQRQLIKELIPELKASLQEDRAVCSIVGYGPPGLGKSTLAALLAKCRGVNMLHFQGSKVTQRDFDVAFGVDGDPSIPNSMRVDRRGYHKVYDPRYGGMKWAPNGQKKYPTLLRLDEWELCHKKICQNLHDVPLPVDSEGNRYYQTAVRGRAVDVFCPEVTLFIITNDMGKLLKNGEALVSRCPIRYRFDPYDHADLTKILMQFADKVDMRIDRRAAEELAAKSKGTPRQALHLFRKAQNVLSARNYDTGSNDRHITYEVVQESFETVGIDRLGLGEFERRYLMLLYQADQKTLPLETLSTILGEQPNTITDVVEPDLMRMGLVTRYQGRGRQLTDLGIRHVALFNAESGNAGFDTDVIVSQRY